MMSVSPKVLQGIKPFTPNLFQVEFLRYTEQNYIMPYTNIYCTGYELPTNALNYERNYYTKQFLPKEIKLSGEVTIHWIDTETLDVWNFHQAWFQRFYDRSTDMFIAGAEGKKLDAKIIIHNQELKNNVMSENEIHTIELKGMSIISVFPLKGSWDEGASWPKFSVKYNVDRIEIQSKDRNKRMI